MKALTIALSVTLLVGIGCKTARRIEVIREIGVQQHLTQKEQQAVRKALPPADPTYPDPAITMETKYAGICPYCDTVNLSDSVLASGGYGVTNGQPITVVIAGGIVTNVVSNSDGNIEQWSIAFTCSNCRMAFSSYRDQLVPKTRSIRLPIRQ